MAARGGWPASRWTQSLVLAFRSAGVSAHVKLRSAEG
mgnify:FL=1